EAAAADELAGKPARDQAHQEKDDQACEIHETSPRCRQQMIAAADVSLRIDETLARAVRTVTATAALIPPVGGAQMRRSRTKAAFNSPPYTKIEAVRERKTSGVRADANPE